MFNILASAKNITVAVLEIVDYQDLLADDNKKYRTFICNRFLNHTREIYPGRKLTDMVMFDGAFNVQLGGKRLKVNNPKLTVMRCVEHTVSLFFNVVSKIPILNQMISAHRMIYIFLVLVYSTRFIPYLNPNIKSSTIEKLVYLVEMRLEWLDFSWECT